MARADHRGRTGAHSQRPGRNKPGSIDGPFIAHRLPVLESRAWGQLSLAARRILDRLEIEHMNHAGRENGALPCAYRDFEAFGIRKSSVKSALDSLMALGFIELTEPGRAGNGEGRRVARYRLTYIATSKAGPTDDWRAHDEPAATPHNIDSGCKSGSGPVGAKAGPVVASIGSDNGSGSGSENGSGVVLLRGGQNV